MWKELKFDSRIVVFSLALGLLLMLVSFALSTSAISLTIPNSSFTCEGTATGFPLPFFYSINHIHGTPPSTHSTGVCTTTAPNISVNALNASLDYLFWFAVSLPIILLLGWIYWRVTPPQVEKTPEQSTIL